MKDFWNKHRKKLLIGAALFGVAIFILAFYLLGFRITYDPAIITDWDAVSAGISLIGVIVSGVAIYYAVQVPKKIADRQDKIALFEKRYEVYSTLSNFLLYARMISEAEEVLHKPEKRYEEFLHIFAFESWLEFSKDHSTKKLSYVDVSILMRNNITKLKKAIFLFDESVANKIINLGFPILSFLQDETSENQEKLAETRQNYIEICKTLESEVVPELSKVLILSFDN